MKLTSGEGGTPATAAPAAATAGEAAQLEEAQNAPAQSEIAQNAVGLNAIAQSAPDPLSTVEPPQHQLTENQNGRKSRGKPTEVLRPVH